MNKNKIFLIFSLLFPLLLCLSIIGCQKSDSSNDSSQLTSEEAETAKLVSRGRSLFNANCTACHNEDPTLDGSLGPAIFGSNLKLLQAKVITGTYPEGYTPKRKTNLMVPLDYLAPDLPAIHAYLNAKRDK